MFFRIRYMCWKGTLMMDVTRLLLFSGLLLPFNCFNLEHVNPNSSSNNISSSAQGSNPSSTTLTTSTTTLSSTLPPSSSYSTTAPSSNNDEQDSTTPLSEMDSNSSKSVDEQREERIVNRPGQRRNQPSNIRRRGDRNRSRGGEQTRRRVEIRRKIEVRNQDENLWGGSNSRRRRPILGSSHIEDEGGWLGLMLGSLF